MLTKRCRLNTLIVICLSLFSACDRSASEGVQSTTSSENRSQGVIVCNAALVVDHLWRCGNHTGGREHGSAQE